MGYLVTTHAYIFTLYYINQINVQITASYPPINVNENTQKSPYIYTKITSVHFYSPYVTAHFFYGFAQSNRQKMDAS
ncbi:hypothetical protein VEZ01S_09_00700 [Vibrio ezurae NBRC 102218]|uniref:Uncharacterized protein n=1 Tax=Vibrio ezurae NBRC 102218 TaxID=1219080 RepID=U3B1H8_9VIBR|nr:hypothetical protein VEZ01S_09_00700 [Vibrio ezurae NBRC 102218]